MGGKNEHERNVVKLALFSACGFELRKVVEHFALSIIEDKICAGRRKRKIRLRDVGMCNPCS